MKVWDREWGPRQALRHGRDEYFGHLAAFLFTCFQMIKLTRTDTW